MYNRYLVVPPQDSLLSLTAHFLTPTLERKQVILQAVKFNESHTGANIASLINSCIQYWKIAEKLTYLVRDNAANYIAGLRDAGIPNFGCLAHTLQLVIHDGVLVQRCVQDLLAASRKLVGHYKHSNIALQTLRRIQNQLNIPQHSLIHDQATRWNSSYYMLLRLIEQKTALLAAGAESACSHELRVEQWNLADKLVHLLQPFEEATREASGDYSSASVTIPIVNSLKRSLIVSTDSTGLGDHGIKGMKRAMLQSLNLCYSDIENVKVFALSTALDPRFKLSVFTLASSSASVRQMLIEEYELVELEKVNDTNPPEPKRARRNTSNNEGTSQSMLWTLFDEIVEENKSGEEAVSSRSVEAAVDDYLRDPVIPRECDPFLYWKEKLPIWPILVKMARKYLFIPPASVPSERLFSTAGQIATDTRNRLDADKIEMLVFLNKNLKYFNFKYKL